MLRNERPCAHFSLANKLVNYNDYMLLKENNRNWYQSGYIAHQIVLAARLMMMNRFLNVDVYILRWDQISPNEHLYCGLLTKPFGMEQLKQLRNPTFTAFKGVLNKHFLNYRGIVYSDIASIGVQKCLPALVTNGILEKTNQLFFNGDLGYQVNTGDFLIKIVSEKDVKISHVECKTCWSRDPQYFNRLLVDTASRYKIHDICVLHVPSRTVFYKTVGGYEYIQFKIDELSFNDNDLRTFFKKSSDHFSNKSNYNTNDLIFKLNDYSKLYEEISIPKIKIPEE